MIYTTTRSSASLDDAEVTCCELVVPPLLAEHDTEAVNHSRASLDRQIWRVPRATDPDAQVLLRQGPEMCPDACSS